jgi:hypothetical protein
MSSKKDGHRFEGNSILFCIINKLQSEVHRLHQLVGILRERLELQDEMTENLRMELGLKEE